MKGNFMSQNLRAPTVEDVEREIESALQNLRSTPLPPGLEGFRHFAPPPGVFAKVVLRRQSEKNKTKYRKIHKDVDASRWDHSSGCEVVLSYLPDEHTLPVCQPEAKSSLSRLGVASPQVSAISFRQRDVVIALDDAERQPRFRDFVGLKQFRDVHLLQRGYSWATDDFARTEALSRAIADDLVRKFEVPNPRSLSYPTTAVKLNREHPLVTSILSSTADERSNFRPLPAIRGIPLSMTIAAERR